MAEGDGVYCSACEEQLGPIEEDLHDPDNIMEFVDGGVSNPDSAHLKAVDGPRGPRLQCSKSGQMSKVVNKDELGDGGGSGGGEPKPEPEPEPEPRGGGEVYDLPEEKDAEDILVDVISNPAYELNDDQVQEVLSWAEIYDGQIPPDTLHSVLGNLSGISKQKASLMRQKYEAFLNKWIQEKSMDSGGPQIGAIATPPSTPQTGPQIPSGGGGQQPQRQPTPEQKPDQPQQDSDEFSVSMEEDMERHIEERSVTESRRERRQERRQDVIDTMAEEMARNMATDAGKFYSDMREIMTTLVKKKAERDPEWFFEKADAFGFDIIDELATPSEAKKKEMENGGRQHTPDMEIDQALEDVMEDKNQGTEPEYTEEPNEPPETPNRDAAISRNDGPMRASPDDVPQGEGEEEESDGDGFDEMFAELKE